MAKGDLHNWHEAVLWKELEKRKSEESNAIKHDLESIMPEIQTVLAHADTAPADFTLHDEGHAFRVAQRMANLLASPTSLLDKLSDYEVALLLLSAYLHDIGMSPQRGKVRAHHGYLLTGDETRLTEAELQEFRAWLDDYSKEIEPPIKPQSAELADEAVTYYCRHKHNDWSEEWIRTELEKHELGSYTDWVDDLVRLCRSHHEGYGELRGERFEPILAPTGSQVVHRRFLAVVLRIADILEFDPERTPEVVLRQRDISPSSRIYWWKDHHISVKQENDRFIITARPPTARIHKAIEVAMDEIDREFTLCRRLADETHFEKCPGLDADLAHRWRFLPSVHRVIEPKEDRYEYVDGSFRPDTEKLLSLLSGSQLYEDELDAIRELLQNAFDAVREQIAYERLSKQHLDGRALAEALAQQHRVVLSVNVEDDGTKVVCTDDGVGMTKRILTNHFLVSGVARRHDVLDLERRCRAAGFDVGRTGQFGIGVLSFFMLAKSVTIRTRRSQEPGDAEAYGWVFETEGVGSFGELRRDKSIQRGTQVVMSLHRQMEQFEVRLFEQRLRNYLKRALVHIPCRLELRSSDSGRNLLLAGPGWVKTESEVADLLIDDLRARLGNEASDVARTEMTASQRRASEIVAEASQQLRWTTTEGQVRGENGATMAAWRIHVPFFELSSGRSLAFLLARTVNDALVFDDLWRGDAFWCSLRPLLSYNGMSVRGRRISAWGRGVPAVVELDWRNPEAARMTVSRSIADPTPEGERVATKLMSEWHSAVGEVFAELPVSMHTWINGRIARSSMPSNTEACWRVVREADQGRRHVWAPVHLPVTCRADPPDSVYLWRNQPVEVLSPLAMAGPRSGQSDRHWQTGRVPPDSAVLLGARLLFVWTSTDIQADPHPLGAFCAFPDAWSGLVLAMDETGFCAWNPKHQVVSRIDREAWELVQQALTGRPNPWTDSDMLLGSPSCAAAWLASCIVRKSNLGYVESVWRSLPKHDSSFLPGIWRNVFGDASQPWTPLWFQRRPVSWSGDPRYYRITPDDWQECVDPIAAGQLPDPGSDWRMGPIGRGKGARSR